MLWATRSGSALNFKVQGPNSDSQHAPKVLVPKEEYDVVYTFNEELAQQAFFRKKKNKPDITISFTHYPLQHKCTETIKTRLYMEKNALSNKY